MPGPARKPASQRRRRNAYPGEATLPAEGRQEPAPPLPEGLGPWVDSIVRWWETIWASPMATQWHATDELALVRLATLMQASLVDGDTKAAAEARQLEDRYGLSAMSRQKLGWQIAGEAPDAETPADRGGDVVSIGSARREDPRGALSAPGR